MKKTKTNNQHGNIWLQSSLIAALSSLALLSLVAAVVSPCCCHICGYKQQVTISLSLFVTLPLYCTDACSFIHKMEENQNKMMGGQTTTS